MYHEKCGGGGGVQYIFILPHVKKRRFKTLGILFGIENHTKYDI